MRKPLFSPQRYLQTSAEAVQKPGSNALGRREWLMARGLCHYQCFDLSNVPPLQRESVLLLKIRQWSPFTDTASYTAWQRGQAQVWIWDHALQQQAQQALAVKNLPVLPESALRPASDNGLRLLPTSDGLEAQIWQQGILRSSRWWAQPPDNAAWQRFLRSHGQAYQPLPEELPPAPLLPKPWAKSSNLLRNLNLLWRQERLWVTLGAAALLSVWLWEWLPITAWQEKITAIDAQIEQLSADAEPILQARSQVLAVQQELQALQTLDIYPDQLKLLVAVAEKLPKDALLLDWKYDNGNLQVKIKADNIDPSEYVKLFQGIALLTDVKPESSNRQGEIEMQARVLPASDG